MEAGSPLSGLRNEINGAAKSSPDAVAKLEAQVEKGEQVNGAGKENGQSA